MRRALLALSVAGLTWGLTVPLSKVVLGWLDPAWTTVLRFGIAAPLLALLARGRLRDAATLSVAAWGAVGFGVVIVLQNIGITRTSVSHAAMLLGAVPVLVALLAAAAGRRGGSSPIAWAGFAIALAGIGLVAGTGGSSSPSGDLLIFGSAVLSAAAIVAQTRLLEGRDPIAVTAVQMAGAAVATLPLALTAGHLPTHGPDGGQLVAMVALVTVGSIVPFSLYAYGQARVRAEVAGAFVNLEPLVGAALGALVFHDPFGPTGLLGALAILTGIGLSAFPVDALRMRRRVP